VLPANDKMSSLGAMQTQNLAPRAFRSRLQNGHSSSDSEAFRWAFQLSEFVCHGTSLLHERRKRKGKTLWHLMYARFMPIRIGIVCENCERLYLIAHSENAEHIQFNPSSDPHLPYRLECTCRAERHFQMRQTLPYRVSESVCSRGYADRHEYDGIPIQRTK
jgi:hypothetical protein